MTSIYEVLRDSIRADEPVALATVIGGPSVGAKLLLRPNEAPLGSLAPGNPAVPLGTPSLGGPIVTAGGLVFSGDSEGNFIAFDAAKGKVLWHFQTGGAVYGGPMAFAIDGKEYVAIAAGSALFAFGLP